MLERSHDIALLQETAHGVGLVFVLLFKDFNHHKALIDQIYGAIKQEEICGTKRFHDLVLFVQNLTGMLVYQSLLVRLL